MRLVQELETEIKRLKRLSDVTPQQLLNELTGTFMYFLKELAQINDQTSVNVERVKAVMLQGFDEHARSIEELHEMFNSGETMLDPEHAETFKACAVALKTFATEAMSGRVAAATPQDLQKFVELADECLRICEEHVMEVEDDEDDGESNGTEEVGDGDNNVVVEPTPGV